MPRALCSRVFSRSSSDLDVIKQLLSNTSTLTIALPSLRRCGVQEQRSSEDCTERNVCCHPFSTDTQSRAYHSNYSRSVPFYVQWCSLMDALLFSRQQKQALKKRTYFFPFDSMSSDSEIRTTCWAVLA